MRAFLDSGEEFSWPPEVGDISGNHCELTTSIIPLQRKRTISDQGPARVNIFKGESEYHFTSQKPFVVKTIKESGTRNSRRRIANEVGNIRDLRHPHITALLGTFTFMERIRILTFPIACCDLKQFMIRISGDLHALHGPSPLESSSSSEGSRWAPEFIARSERTLLYAQKKSGVWPLNSSLEFKRDSLRRFFVCLSKH